MESTIRHLAVVVMLLSMTAVTSGQTDVQYLTRTDQATGPEVVEAVVDEVRRSCVLPQDNLLLRRLAYVESHDGTDKDTFRSNFYGGIWQVTQQMYDRTKTSSYLQDLRTGIREHLGIDWMSTSWQDLTKPLYSCLAAALYIVDVLRSRPHPVGVEAQANFWASDYHRGASRYNYTSLANLMEKGCHWGAKLDLIFIVDTSSSISSQDFEHAKQFIVNVSSDFDLASGSTRVGIITYSTGARVVLSLGQVSSQSGLESYVRGLSYDTGGTDTNLALDQARVQFETHPRSDAVKVVVVVTDGVSHDRIDTNQAALSLASTAGGVMVLSVGVGDQLDKDELNAIASNPSCTHSFQVENYGQIEAMVEEIQRLTCRAPLPLYVGQTVHCEMTKCPPYVVNVPAGTHVMVKVNTTCPESFNTYASSVSPYPLISDYQYMVQVNTTGDSVFYIPQSASQFYLNVAQGPRYSDYHCMVTLTALRNVVQVVCLDSGRQRACSPQDLRDFESATGQHLCL